MVQDVWERTFLRSVTTVPHLDAFLYVTERRRWVAKLRESCKDRTYLFYANDPLIVNEIRLGEVSLAVVENGKIVLTNFIDLPGIVERLKVYRLGELWLNYAEGGTERALRFGEPGKEDR